VTLFTLYKRAEQARAKAEAAMDKQAVLDRAVRIEACRLALAALRKLGIEPKQSLISFGDTDVRRWEPTPVLFHGLEVFPGHDSSGVPIWRCNIRFRGFRKDGRPRAVVGIRGFELEYPTKIALHVLLVKSGDAHG
jgi:hypothetical protein